MKRKRESYAVARVCNDCPFRRTGGIRVTAARTREIAGWVLGNPGGTFDCHKTTGTLDDDDTPLRRDSRHCAGALIFAEKHGKATQMTRVMERVGLYDAKALLATPEAADVFDSVAEMLAAALPDRNRAAKGP